MTFGQLGFDQMSIHCTVNQLSHSIKWYVDQMVIKQLTLHREKVLSMVLTLYPDHQGQGTLNRVWSASTALTVSLGKTFIKTKVVGKDHFSGGGSGRTRAPCASGAMVNHFLAKFIKPKL
jgi:hypothetical protein